MEVARVRAETGEGGRGVTEMLREEVHQLLAWQWHPVLPANRAVALPLVVGEHGVPVDPPRHLLNRTKTENLSRPGANVARRGREAARAKGEGFGFLVEQAYTSQWCGRVPRRRLGRRIGGRVDGGDPPGPLGLIRARNELIPL